jgi:hypothetical protein
MRLFSCVQQPKSFALRVATAAFGLLLPLKKVWLLAIQNGAVNLAFGHQVLVDEFSRPPQTLGISVLQTRLDGLVESADTYTHLLPRSSARKRRKGEARLSWRRQRQRSADRALVTEAANRGLRLLDACGFSFEEVALGPGCTG